MDHVHRHRVRLGCRAALVATCVFTVGAAYTEATDDAAQVTPPSAGASGDLDALRSGHIDAIGSPPSPALDWIIPRARSVDPTVGNPNPWAGLIDDDDVHFGFETEQPHISLATSDDWTPLAGQSTPQGYTWNAAPDFNGVVDNATAQSGPNWNPSGSGFDRHGVAGGPDPAGARSRFFVSPRGSIEPQSLLRGTIQTQAQIRHKSLEPTADSAVAIVMDIYLDDIETVLWVRPISFKYGCITAAAILGGHMLSGVPNVTGADGVAKQFVTIGRPTRESASAELFRSASGHTLIEREWMQVGVRLTGDSLSLWVRDSSTIGVYGFEQDSMYDGHPGDPTRGAFAGEIFEQDWLQVFPGLTDDPATASVEGIGPAVGEFLSEVEVFLDGTGSPAGAPFFAGKAGVDAVQFISGSDPSSDDVPGFQPHDWYLDNYTVLGSFCPSDIAPSPRDGVVDGADLGLLLGQWGANGTGDLNGDGVVDGADLGLLLSAWGPCP